MSYSTRHALGPSAPPLANPGTLGPIAKPLCEKREDLFGVCLLLDAKEWAPGGLTFLCVDVGRELSELMLYDELLPNPDASALCLFLIDQST